MLDHSNPLHLHIKRLEFHRLSKCCMESRQDRTGWVAFTIKLSFELELLHVNDSELRLQIPILKYMSQLFIFLMVLVSLLIMRGCLIWLIWRLWHCHRTALGHLLEVLLLLKVSGIWVLLSHFVGFLCRNNRLCLVTHDAFSGSELPQINHESLLNGSEVIQVHHQLGLRVSRLHVSQYVISMDEMLRQISDRVLAHQRNSFCGILLRLADLSF